MIGRKRCADLIVGNDRQIDQEAEDPRPQEVPETNRCQKRGRPEMREWGLRFCLLLRAQLNEAPRLESEDRQRNYFRSPWS